MYKDDAKFTKDAILNIQKETQRLTEMVEKILKLRSLERYDFEYTMKEIEIKSAIEDIIERMKGKATKFNIVIESNISRAYIIADRDFIIQIFVNLIDNAIKYNKRNGQIIINSENKKNSIEITVSDTGIGIPEKDWNKIFEPFYTINKKISKSVKGTGLGLSIVKKIIETMNGTIKIKNSGYLGTTILIIFPINSKKYL